MRNKTSPAARDCRGSILYHFEGAKKGQNLLCCVLSGDV